MSEESLDDLITAWLMELRHQGRRPGTIAVYSKYLREFVAYAGNRGTTSLQAISRSDISAWQTFQLDRELTPGTRAAATYAVKGWLRWLATNEYPVSPNLWLRVSPVRVPQRLPRPLEPDHLAKLLECLASVHDKEGSVFYREVDKRWAWALQTGFRTGAKTVGGYARSKEVAQRALEKAIAQRDERALTGPDFHVLRDRALLLFLLSTGARLFEALQVNRDDYKAAVVWRKGQRQGMLVPSPIAIEAIETYLATRRDSLPWLWIGQNGRLKPVTKLGAIAVRRICAEWAERAGIPRFTPHQLRHSAATITYDLTGDALAAADFLGHANLQTLRNYAKVSKRRREAMTETIDTALRELQHREPVSTAPGVVALPTMAGPVLLTLEDVGRMISMPVDLVERLIAEGHVPGVVQIGTERRVKRAELEAWIESLSAPASGLRVMEGER